MAAMKTLGDLLDGSGWTGALVLAGVATHGTADSYLKVTHVTRTRRTHQVTACSLYLLMKKAYTLYSNQFDDGQEPLSLDEWCTEQADLSPQFQFWFIILQLQLTILIYVRSIREGNFLLYIDALSRLVLLRFLAAHEMAVALGPNKCRGLPFFHAFTGCDNVSCFGGKGKTTAW